MDKQFLTGRVKQVNADERTLTAYASTGGVDRDKEVILPSAWEGTIEAFKNNAVLLWAHNYSIPPVGKVTDLGVDDHGLKFKAQFAETTFADEIWQLYKGGFLNSFSVGFIPKKWEDSGEEEKDVLRTFTETELLEISAVPVPSNPHATVERGVPIIAFKSVDEFRLPEVEIKTVVPYADHGTDRGDWSAPTLSNFTSDPIGELSASERRRIAAHYTWSANMLPEAFTDLKLPHHRGGRSGVGPAVWRGVTAAMAALLGARGGVDVPAGDRRGIYNHLSKHYKQFDAEAPEFRAYEVDELETLFPTEKDEPIEPAPIQVDDKDGSQEPAPEPEPDSEPGTPETNNNENDELQSEVLDALGELFDALGGMLGVT